MPNLQEHMLRVTDVASLVCVFKTMNLDIPKLKKIQKEFIGRYGRDEHNATYKICGEIGVTGSVYKIVKAYGFSKGEKTYQSIDFNQKIAAYF